MPVRRGHVAPRTTIIETIIRKFDTHNRSFLVANAQRGLCHIIYCSDGFCRMTGFSRAEVMQRPASCEFLHGPLTSQHAAQVVRDALAVGAEKHFEILYYRKDGTKFLCSQVIAPIKSEVDDICLYIINFEDLTAPPAAEEDVVLAANTKLSKLDRARQSFRQSLRMGSLRGRGLRLAGYLTPPSDVTAEDADGDEDHDHEATRPSIGRKEKEKEKEKAKEEEKEKEKDKERPLGETPAAPIASPEAMSEEAVPSVPHATSLDAITRRPRLPEPQQPPARSATVAGPTRNHVSKAFPITSSESDLQRVRTTTSIWERGSHDRKSPSLSNVPSDSLKHKFSIQDNGSAKFFQGALHTPNMGEKVAQINFSRMLHHQNTSWELLYKSHYCV
ncbi:potassium voltage-gated channel subfamily H member 2-like isoform X1 [Schistocerca serialis cubense]|uniref:potassium voltage-gated channel subfamily H member 2-like isoform X1 n=1 Tax=Schistocerca serialis cubense TaxID=2023355 RepID=UPI00214E8ABC|nr:potassium voltage-gated channel subfamily H member 2-like isoform X1 [Schistocerca serialis cubense]